MKPVGSGRGGFRVLVDARIDMPPLPKGRPRATTDKKTGKSRVRTPKKTAQWERDASWFVARGTRKRGFTGPVSVACEFVFERPRRRPDSVPPDVWERGLRVARPVGADLDNLLKSTWDAAQIVGALSNDAQVVEDRSSKAWAAEGESAHVRFVVTTCGWYPATPCRDLLGH